MWLRIRFRRDHVPLGPQSSRGTSPDALRICAYRQRIYNNTHPYFAESDEKARGEWPSSLDNIEALSPRAAVASHGVLDPESSALHIAKASRHNKLTSLF
jgi:hypothetical protein